MFHAPDFLYGVHLQLHQAGWKDALRERNSEEERTRRVSGGGRVEKGDRKRIGGWRRERSGQGDETMKRMGREGKGKNTIS